MAAPSCSLSSSTMTFSTINPQYAGTVYTSGTAVMTCIGFGANATVSACLSIGAGNAAGSNATNRVLSASGTTTRIPIVISATPSSGQQIGNGTSYPKEGPVTVAANASGQATASFPITVAITGPLTATPRTYSNTFTGNNFRATYRTPSNSSCTAITTNATGGQLLVQAQVVPGCAVTATPLNFGTAAALSTALTATSTIQLTCTAGVTATVGLDNGQTGTGPSARLMKLGTNSVSYGIYRDNARTLPWGNTTGTDTLSLVVGGTSATATAYGKVPVQTWPQPGTYTDVVNVNVVY
jgi:spore coat protein U-like protein